MYRKNLKSISFTTHLTTRHNYSIANDTESYCIYLLSALGSNLKRSMSGLLAQRLNLMAFSVLSSLPVPWRSTHATLT